ncbi:MAG: type II toxin-antitoxin system RelE/ParE family toxin [Mesorhizobium sp.]|nr:MAG: type II toxin-antitoxin system RelE/ParE family toxin [Mesorhizobium sp.]
MYRFVKSDEFDAWFNALKDMRAKARILARIVSAEKGNFGDCEPVGSGVLEMRIHYGPGYRLYYTRQGDVLFLLLIGGDKGSQKRDIKSALEMVTKLRKDRP